MQPFGVSVSELRPGCLKIEIQGELDLAVSDRLTQALASAGGHSEVLVDLTRCDFVDSTAIEAILQAEQLLALEGKRIVVVGARSQVLRVLNVMGLTNHGLVLSAAAEALDGGPTMVAT
jgi:anti-sigma B factor antagonist